MAGQSTDEKSSFLAVRTQLRELIAKDKRQAQTVFAAHSLEEQREIVLASPNSERLDLLYLPEDSTELVRSLPAVELHRTVRDVKWEAQEIVEVASNDQINFMLDHDCWKGEKLSSRRFLDWLRLFLSCEPVECERILRSISVDLLALVLKKHVHFMRDFVIDSRYYCDPDWVRGSNPEVQEFLERLYATAPDFWVRLMYWVRTHSQPTLIADAITHREFRLSGKGFPSQITALSVYDPIDFDVPGILSGWHMEFRRNLAAEHLPHRAEPTVLFMQNVLMTLTADDKHGERYVNRIEHSLSELANKVMMADSVDLDDHFHQRQTVDKVRRWVNIGMEAETGSDLSLGTVAVRRQKMEHFFRLAGMLFEALTNAIIAARKEDHRLGAPIKHSTWTDVWHALCQPEPKLPSADAGLAHQSISRIAEYRYAWEVIWHLETMLRGNDRGITS